MNNYRLYGQLPYTIAVVHGGPGAPGSMAAIATALSEQYGILEPLQTARTLKNQMSELVETLCNHAKMPIILIGHSWGAFLSYLVAANYPHLIKKLIMVGAGVFEEHYASRIMATRMARLNEQDQQKFSQLTQKLDQSNERNKDQLFLTLGQLCTSTDILNPITLETNLIKVDYQQYQDVWQDFVKLRKSGELLRIGQTINCPVVAIHGDYDPHPIDGIKHSLSTIIKDFKFILLEKCGHYPWLEQDAQTRFYHILEHELKEAS